MRDVTAAHLFQRGTKTARPLSFSSVSLQLSICFLLLPSALLTLRSSAPPLCSLPCRSGQVHATALRGHARWVTCCVPCQRDH
eukprot:837437-Rhodomonas_salina.1